jgi:hypothetical protein
MERQLATNVRTRRIRNEDLEERVWTPRTILWLVAILICVTAVLWSVYMFRSTNPGPFRQEYEGQIVEKWADYSHSEQGSQPYFRLLVKGPDSQQFSVSVSSEIYDRARVGMFVRKTDAGVELLANEPTRQSVAPAQ